MKPSHVSWSVAIALALTPACRTRRSIPTAPPSPDREPAGGAARADAASRAVLDVVRDFDSCSLGHSGVLLDLGDRSTRDALRPGSLAVADDEVVEGGGATWLRVRSRSLTVSFYWPAVEGVAPDANAYVEARTRGITARAVAVAIDGKSVGSWPLAKGEIRTSVARATTPVTLTPGGHELTIRFVGGSRAGDALADVDWVHVGTGEPAPSYAAPTRGDALVDAAVGARSMRAVSLHSPGFVRCSGWIPADATLEASLATVGGGDADVEARLLRDRQPPIVLGTAHVRGGAPSWLPWSVPVAGLEGDGALAALELVARRSDASTRVLFGSPRLVAARPVVAASTPRARSALLVVLGSTSAGSLAPWGGPHAAPELSALASGATLFLANRASSSIADADVAAMLTGLPPQALGLEDDGARLPAGPTLVSEACRQAGVVTAMFTADPTTGPAFGFDRGWDTFVLHDPLEDVAATRVFDDAAAWIEAHHDDRFFVVVHARGGHPPWDATPDELKTMPPAGYFGVIEPHRAAEELAKVQRRVGHFKDEDRVRAWALYDRAVDAHDAALGRLLSAVRAAGRDDDTAIFVTGDVGANEAGPVPFVDTDALDEPLLGTPLVARWPHAPALSGRRVGAPTGPGDLARSILDALGLEPPAMVGGVDLARVALGGLVPAERPLLATSGDRFAARWGPFVLTGAHEREARMCDLSLDPTCVADVRATAPLALEPLHRWTREAIAASGRPRFAREAVVLDARTRAALVRWGHGTDEDGADDTP